MPVDVVVVGSCVTDYIARTPQFPRPGETVFGHSLTVGFGGKGANQCLQAAKLGASTAIVCKFGQDAVGDNFIAELQRTSIDISQVKRTPHAQSAIANVIVDDNGENCIVNIPGANRLMTVEDVDAASDVIKTAKVLICQNEISFEATKAALILARKNGVTTVLNAGPGVPDLDPEIIRNSDILCVNETEAEVLTGIEVREMTDAATAAKALLTKGCREVVITLGAKGVVRLDADSVAAGSDYEWVETQKVTAVDTTGAGDSFIGALAFYLSCLPSLSMKEKLRRSCVVATQSVLKPGAWGSLPAKHELPSQLFDA
ncbi:Ribokinase [Trinorchestia longiramus]|nr:Ribokinase [Trinorchestia longiramus]